VLVCVSGGSDSVALLTLLSDTSSVFSFSLGVAHVNYGLRGEQSEEEANYVSHLSKELRLPYHYYPVTEEEFKNTKGTGLEEKARNLRRSFFLQLCRDYDYSLIALGHTRDDLVETFLFNLIRGTSPDGIAELMPRVTKKESIVRPLLSFDKKSLITLLNQKHITYFTDTTNLESHCSRNKIRNQVIPVLEEINPSMGKSLLRFKEILTIETEYLAEQTRQVLVSCETREKEGQIVINQEDFLLLTLAIQTRVIREIRFRLTDNRCDFYFFQIKSIVLGIIDNKKFSYKDKWMRIFCLDDCIVFEKA